jgi:hypothetical protein
MKKDKPTPKKPESNKKNNLRFNSHAEMLFVHKAWKRKEKEKNERS